MDFAISIPTLLISVGLIILFRITDKRNRSLEKLKRFSDRIREELNLFIRDKGKELEKISTGIDEQLNKGREILKRILSFEEMLANKAEDFDKMRKTVDAYSSTLEELISMSARADENLKRLGEESRLVEQLSLKLKDISGKISKFDGELRQTEKNFLEHARQELSGLGTRLTQEQEAKNTKLKSEVEKIENRAQELAEFLKRLEARKQDTVREAETTLQQALKGFKVEIQQEQLGQCELFKQEIDSYLEDAKEQTQKYKEQMQASQKHFKELETDFATKIEDFKEQFSQVERMFYKHLENAARRGEDFEDEAFANLKKSFENSLHLHEKEMATAFANLKEELEERKREIVNLFGTLRSDTNIWHAQLKTQMVSAEKELNNRLRELENLAKNSVAEATGLAEKIQREAGVKVDNFINSTSSKLKQLDGELLNVRRETEELFSLFEKDSSQLEEKVLTAIEKRLADYEEEVSYRLAKLGTISVDVQALEKSMQENLHATSLRLRNEFAELENELACQRQTERNRALAELDQLRNQIEQLDTELEAIKDKGRATIEAKVMALEEEFINRLAEKTEALEKKMANWSEELETSLAHDKTKSEAEIEKLSAHYQKLVERQLAAFKKELEAELANIEKQTKGFETSVSEIISEKETILESLADEFKQQIEMARQKTLKEIENLNASFNKNLLNWRDGIEKRTTDFEKEFSKLLSEKEKLLVQRSDSLQKDLEAFKLKAQNQLEALEETVVKLKAKSSTLQKGFLDSFEPKRKELENRLEEIEKRTREFIAQTKLFERADSLKIGLEADISLLKKEIAKIEAHKKEINEVSADLVNTKKAVEDVSSRLREFMAERKRIELIDSNFRRLLELSRSIDEKLDNATNQHDLLQNLELKFREFENLVVEVENRFARLENKKKILDTTTNSVDKNFEQLTNLEKELKNFERELRNLSKIVSEIKRDVEYINKDRDKTSDAVLKLNKLDDVLTDIETRMEKMATAREWLARTETRLNEINKQADEHLSLLGSLLKEEAARSNKEKGAPDYDKRQMVTQLARRGWSAEEIARATKLSRGEVELILELISDKV